MAGTGAQALYSKLMSVEFEALRLQNAKEGKKMEWIQLMSKVRLERPDAFSSPGRSPFQQDIDRIVFSSAFRRLAHKTQVHPLSSNDHVHTRLTHSIEVASVGRSLGTIVGAEIVSRYNLPPLTADAFGYVVQAACLAHDIGNPPFGHSGEDAICDWFQNQDGNTNVFRNSVEGAQREDLRHFEGNAQGFRILTQLENYKWAGGLQLTYAVLGTFSKYPRSSVAVRPGDNYPGGKKLGFFDSEREYFSKVAAGLGLVRRQENADYWCRHPLAFLVEAADDICYAVIDIEDGYELGYLSYKEARDILAPIAGANAKISSSMAEPEQIAKYRAVAIGELVNAASSAFLDNEAALLAGTFDREIIDETPYKKHIKDAKELAKVKLYWSDRKTKLEIAGNEIIHGLLDIFKEMVEGLEQANWDVTKLRGKTQKLARLLPLDNVSSRYAALQRVADFISGMTDRYAVDLFRNLRGISTGA